jgi:hypothetical protein
MGMGNGRIILIPRIFSTMEVRVMKRREKLVEWFQTFFEEKDLAEQEWEIVHKGQTHFIGTEFVKELLVKSTPERELVQVRDMLVKIDFVNGDVNHFLKHLAESYIKTRY